MLEAAREAPSCPEVEVLPGPGCAQDPTTPAGKRLFCPLTLLSLRCHHMGDFYIHLQVTSRVLYKLKKSVRKVLFLCLSPVLSQRLWWEPSSPLRHPQKEIIPQKRQKTLHQHFGGEFFPNLDFSFILNPNSREFTPQGMCCFPFLLKIM